MTRAVINPLEINHEADKNFYILESMGHEIQNKKIEIWTDEIDDQKFKQKFISQNEKIIIIVPGGSHSRKQWEPKKYATLINKILATNKNVKFVVLGSGAERGLGERIKKNTVSQNIINLCGQTTLRQAGSICKIGLAYIGSDTGLMHIAAAVGLPILSPNCCADNVKRTPYTVPERINPWQVLSVVITPKEPKGECKNVISAYGCIAEQAHCINQISVDDMYGGWEKLNLMIEASKKTNEERENINRGSKKIILICAGNIGVDLVFNYGVENVEFYCDYEGHKGNWFGKKIITFEELEKYGSEYRVIIGLLHEKFMLLIEKKLMQLNIHYERYWDEVICEREKKGIIQLKFNLANRFNEYKKFIYNDEVMYMLEKQKPMMIPYRFIEKYQNIKYQINKDGNCGMYYYLHNKKKLYFPRFYTKRRCEESIEALLIEQDQHSPHKYFMKGHEVAPDDIFIDIGGAEGIASLDVVDIAQKIYIFEYDRDWLEALEHTFAPYRNRVMIVSKMVGHETTKDMMKIDDLFSNTCCNLFIKVDIEGYEPKFLMGADNTLRSNNVKLSLCTYHHYSDAFLFEKYLIALGYNTKFTPGYVYRLWADGEFVKGVLLAQNTTTEEVEKW